MHRESTNYDPSFVDAAFSVENVGDVAAPAVSSLGYGVYIVKYLRDVPEGAVELTEEIRESIRSGLLEERQNEMYHTTMDLWRDESDIVYTPAGEAYVTKPAEEAPLATPSDLE